VIVVDSSPNDKTRTLTAGYANALSSIRYIFEEQKGHSVARNRGCLEAGGAYLIYLDDDATIPVNYLENVVRVISDYSPDIIGGPVYPVYTCPKPWWFSDDFEIRKYENQSGFSRSCGISGGNFIIRKSILQLLGLFDPGYGMSGSKLGMLDERKVLETYRFQTAPERQKVYYSLDCYIDHYTPADKMRLNYMLRRSFVAGEALYQMYVDITGKPDHKKGVDLYVRGFLNIFYEMPRTAIKRGFRDKKFVYLFIDGIIRISKGTGFLMAQLRCLVKRTIRR
jgi:glycosyltransferase involved in cell wall biosynthesis